MFLARPQQNLYYDFCGVCLILYVSENHQQHLNSKDIDIKFKSYIYMRTLELVSMSWEDSRGLGERSAGS